MPHLCGRSALSTFAFKKGDSMRLRSAVLAFCILLLLDVTAHAAPIYTFGVQGTTDFDTTSIHSFALNAGPPETFSFVKDVDATSPDFLLAVATGTSFALATFIAYDGSITPANEIFRYTFANVIFTGLQTSGGTQIPTETVSLTAQSITRVEGPAAVPEPASLLLLGSGVAGIAVRMRRRRKHQLRGR
jgi:hypothetical protein